MAGYWALKELVAARTREFLREPEAIFWVYVFPIFLMVGLGIAFSRSGPKELRVAVTDPRLVEGAAGSEAARRGLSLRAASLEEARSLYRERKVDLIVRAEEGRFEYIYDPLAIDAELARLRTDDFLQRAAGRGDTVPSSDAEIREPGSRYVDWLIPGLLGMNIMGAGLWGVGFVTVDLRMRKLLKRFAASPMRRSDFLLALIASRMLFILTEVIVILLVGHLGFGMTLRGSALALAAVVFAGAIGFSGLGLLLASRTDKIEVISGLLNIVMLPMWLCSGIFFSYERFPESLQPFIRALPLTQLNDGLRRVILEGASLGSQWFPVVALSAFGLAGFALALRWFRW
ncbi:MAG: ABC transporter permease [Planctomycetota bacterium]